MDHQHRHKNVDGLLEQGWFFGNSLDRKTGRRMARCLSDPCSLTNDGPEGQSYEETYAAIKKLEKSGKVKVKVTMTRAPSMAEREDHAGRRKSYRKTSTHNLLRAPSLPASLETRELVDDEEEEMEFSMGKLIRQASMNDADRIPIPPRTRAAKGLRSRTEPDNENVKFEGMVNVKPQPQPQYPMNQLRTHKSLTDLESEVLQCFKDLGFDHNKTELTPEKKSPAGDESWRSQSSSPPLVPNWVGRSSTKDMKAQIKFWARSVASNVRQEC